MFDSEQWREVFDSMAKNKLRAVLTGVSVFTGIFMLIILLGAGRGLRNGFEHGFKGNAINAIQESTAKSVSGMDKAVEEIETATGFASQSGDALRQIVSNVETTADQVRAIATASEEQSAASEEINHSITQVNEMSNQTAQAMGEAAQAVAELARQAQALNQLITEMKQG